VKLDKSTIAREALKLLAVGGLKGLSTRKLADHLGIKGASLYHHFLNKQELLDHVADAMIFPALRPPEPGEPWDEWLVRVAVTVRRRVLAYPDGGLLYAGARPPLDVERERVDYFYKPLLDAGLSQNMTRDTVLAVIRFTIGWIVDEQIASNRSDKRSQHGFEFGLHALVWGVQWKLGDQSGRATP